MLRNSILLVGLALGLGLLTGCDETSATGPDSASALQAVEPQLNKAADKKLDLALCSPSRGGFSLKSTNPYFPLQVGSQWRYRGAEDGALLRLVITVLDETEVVAGVTTRVVEERESEDGELVEVSRNFFAEAGDGTVCYFGEEVDIYEDGEIVSHEGAWRADEPGNRPGIIMPAHPRPGTKYQNEDAPGVAEDEAKIVGIGPVEVPAGTFTETIRVREFNPLDGDKGYKVFAAGVGLIIDEVLELVSY
jgi:hypothetical protein